MRWHTELSAVAARSLPVFLRLKNMCSWCSFAGKAARLAPVLPYTGSWSNLSGRWGKWRVAKEAVWQWSHLCYSPLGADPFHLSLARRKNVASYRSHAMRACGFGPCPFIYRNLVRFVGRAIEERTDAAYVPAGQHETGTPYGETRARQTHPGKGLGSKGSKPLKTSFNPPKAHKAHNPLGYEL